MKTAMEKQHDVVARIRYLEDKKNREPLGGLSLEDCTELHELQLIAKENNWIYW